MHKIGSLAIARLAEIIKDSESPLVQEMRNPILVERGSTAKK
jgi:DNA-binding LacI/PurR family transcriptional regulator